MGPLILGWTVAAAAAAPCDTGIRIHAEVSEDLREVRGLLWPSPSLREADWVDPLARLPEPEDDLRLLRTYPGRPNRGEIRWAEDGGVITFETRLPERFGALGATRHGLFANGGWYPQPMVDGAVPQVQFTVAVQIAEGHVAALGGRTGTDVVAWTGCGERASLAVVPDGVTTPLAEGRTQLLTRGAPRRGLVRELEGILSRVEGPVPLLVQGPLRRRLTRHRPGLTYVSDRAFRLTSFARFAHRRAVARGVLAGTSGQPNPQLREVVAFQRAQAHDAALQGSGADRLLGAFSWVPQVNALLASQRTPFYAEILDRVHPGDPVSDDLLEVLDPYTPGAALLTQVADRHGPEARDCVGFGVRSGLSLAAAAEGCPVDVAGVLAWQGPYPDQDYTFEVEGPALHITRDAPSGAPDEVVILRIDGEDQPEVMAPGQSTVMRDAPPRRVVLDPARHTAQRSRVNDAWPPRYDVTFAASLRALNLSQRQLFGSLFMTLRRQYDTRNLLIGSLSNSQADLISVDVAFLRKIGPLLDGWTRPHRVQVRGGVSWFNQRFAATESPLALDASVSWAHDTRVNADFPVRGHRVGTAVSGGLVPGTNDAWFSLSGSAMGVASPHPRHAIAARSSLALARSGLPQRRLTLGGASVMRSIPTRPACTPERTEDCTRVASERAFGAVEYRVAVLRNASVPLWLAWGSELQLAVGLEGLVARLDDGPVWSTGATVGIYGLGDVLGAETMGIGLTAAWPLAVDPAFEEVELTPIPEFYLRFTQAF